VDCGAYSEGFPELTPAEMYCLIRSAGKRRELESRNAALIAWHSAHLTGLAVNAPRSFPRTPEEYFPFLRQDIPAWKRAKQQMARIAAAHNSRNREVQQ
jgi:hypothetical protein